MLLFMKHSVHSKGYKAFRARLIIARNEAKMSQIEVAELIGQRQAYVSKCETGERRVDVVELLEFAMIYKKNIAFFVDGIDLPNVSVPETTRTARPAPRKKRAKEL